MVNSEWWLCVMNQKPKTKQQKDNIKLTLNHRNIMTFAVRKKIKE